jgi:hypothetical protein
MGQRKEPRKDIKVPVRIFGTDREGQIFSEKVFTVNVSRSGAELCDVKALPNPEEIIGLTYGATKVHFRVKWVGPPGTPKAGHLGLLNLTPEKTLWDFPLPAPAFDSAVRAGQERRTSPRTKCVNSVELYPKGQDTPIRARTSDMALGGCFVEMPNPLPKGTDIKIAIWIKDSKLWAMGKVAHSTPGFGIGVQFLNMSELEKAQLQQFLKSVARLPV